MSQPFAPQSPAPLSALENAAEFLPRHVGINAADEAQMLAVIGEASRRALIESIVPRSIARSRAMDLPPPVTEAAALAELRALAARNRVLKSFIGQGYYGTHTPGVIQRNILENPAWYTAYTPYQSEISQGRMEALVNFQTMVCDLTGMPIANASMLDEATAAAEAMALAKRSVKSASERFVVAGDAHPQTIEVIRTRAAPLGIDVVLAQSAAEWDAALAGDYFAVLAQYPASSGRIDDLRADVQKVHARQAALIVAADLLALTLLSPPGEWGADIVVGSSQRFGMPMGAGGPHAAYMACRDAFKRSLPGRLVGVSVDAHGRPAYRLALQTREQHIRREKATSNICTAQALPAVIASMYAVYHGPAGLRRIALRVASYTAILAKGLEQLGAPLHAQDCFDTLVLRTGDATRSLAARALQWGANLRVCDENWLCISLDETTTRADVELLWRIFAGDARDLPAFDAFEPGVEPLIPAALRRRSSYLTHPVFNTHHSETGMLRYLRALADKDLALDRSMIPLGSCTMKLNATSEMIPITWPEFAGVHPFAPADQLQGYYELDAQLRAWLCQATGYAGVSLQPNAGSQGEYAGLLAIRAWHRARGQGQRTVCLIPSSAHGTNPASAQMAGMQVVVSACDARGNVDLADLQAQCERHSANLAAVMITYPSTHGVFETQVKELCALVHRHGGLVYVDGANMNALVGVAAPGEFGGDVSHLNLHKTFCIPHGGGGPGVGPVCVVQDLVPYLPGHATAGIAGGVGAVSAAPLGNAAVLPISWMYCRMMGAEGLRVATESAILSANYVSARLKAHYPTLYASANGHVAHECILDLRPLKESSGVLAEDVAKRLIDYGFHAPTLSFPVPNTLMVEPTESETLSELDRFIDAMIAIRAEIRQIEAGVWPRDDNPLKNAPHTAESLLCADWQRPYSRETAAYPVASLRKNKYWSPVGRVDNLWGERNLSCSCIPVSDYA
ncbi:glycine dehydrogenase (aminomethyl-transferring) [Verminephrobacter aporrectodeae subsp. tuberculatae]|uniref:aminomethyl-transferring glycine dehydrogenase n=1 Tax=Verminephrobacter aporrectodeae TaxID=1110389 RepID=UPI0022384F74|nr:aminomethyl-transferring glycine dehydrogenase [Verminephrobacter aporrectodeae]MCW5222102.1 glycine dehydrogenase (aminomethyl-transferring) [Verminephrobacter aporrectodeae subsp. tuberculatae]MCW5291393.1 glycine dehydrogenase (aminomethyl-transferring) [Verminephrobacter aporrectodeae subsp. tuberculatae]